MKKLHLHKFNTINFIFLLLFSTQGCKYETNNKTTDAKLDTIQLTNESKKPIISDKDKCKQSCIEYIKKEIRIIKDTTLSSQHFWTNFREVNSPYFTYSITLTKEFKGEYPLNKLLFILDSKFEVIDCYFNNDFEVFFDNDGVRKGSFNNLSYEKIGVINGFDRFYYDSSLLCLLISGKDLKFPEYKIGDSKENYLKNNIKGIDNIIFQKFDRIEWCIYKNGECYLSFYFFNDTLVEIDSTMYTYTQYE
jgi:hypothetical protein